VNRLAVIAAKAGIHEEAQRSTCSWIPAFAGMTVVVDDRRAVQ